LLETIIKPRASETNSAGHIGATVLPVWFEEGCHEFLRVTLGELDFYYFQARLEQDFQREIFHGHDVSVRTQVKCIGNSSVTLAQEVWQKGQRCAAATSVLVHVDRATNKPSPVSQALREQLQPVQG